MFNKNVFLLLFAQISQLLKLGSQSYEDMKQFSCAVEEALFKLQAHRDRALKYKMEEVQITVVDELYVEQNAEGHVDKQIARVRLFFLGFLSGRYRSDVAVLYYCNWFFSQDFLYFYLLLNSRSLFFHPNLENKTNEIGNFSQVCPM